MIPPKFFLVYPCAHQNLCPTVGDYRGWWGNYCAHFVDEKPEAM